MDITRLVATAALVTSVALGCVTLGCAPGPEPASQASQASAAASGTHRAGPVASTSASHGANPLQGASSQDRGRILRGRIAERLPAGGYTYLDVRTADGAGQWAVVLGDRVPATGSEVTLVTMVTRTDFYSRRLDRRFDHLIFASVADRRVSGVGETADTTSI